MGQGANKVRIGVSKVAKAVVEAAERRADTQHEWHSVRKMNYVHDITICSLN